MAAAQPCEEAMHYYMRSDLSLLQSGYQSDAQILTDDGGTLDVHTAVLGSRSEWFRKSFEEAPQDEDGVWQLEISDRSVDTIYCLLLYIYSGDIALCIRHLQWMDRCTNVSVFSHCLLLAELGDDFCVPRLLDGALARLETECAAQLVQVRTDGYDTALDATLVEDVVDGIRQAFNLKPGPAATTCQDVFVKFVYAGRQKLFSYEAFCELIDEVPDFAARILRNVISDSSWGEPLDSPPGVPAAQHDPNGWLLERSCRDCEAQIGPDEVALHIPSDVVGSGPTFQCYTCASSSCGSWEYSEGVW